MSDAPEQKEDRYARLMREVSLSVDCPRCLRLEDGTGAAGLDCGQPYEPEPSLLPQGPYTHTERIVYGFVSQLTDLKEDVATLRKYVGKLDDRTVMSQVFR